VQETLLNTNIPIYGNTVRNTLRRSPGLKMAGQRSYAYQHKRYLKATPQYEWWPLLVRVGAVTRVEPPIFLFEKKIVSLFLNRYIL
jgi:hypothetical protein